MDIRRVVIGHDGEGKSVIISDGKPPRSRDMKHTPGMGVAVLWKGQLDPKIPAPEGDPTDIEHAIPAPPSTHFFIIKFPPDSVIQDPDYDIPKAMDEQLEILPKFITEVDPDGMHASNSIDYGVILAGEVWCELDSGDRTLLKTGDTYVMNGARHSWHSEGDAGVTIALITQGAVRTPTEGPAAAGIGP